VFTVTEQALKQWSLANLLKIVYFMYLIKMTRCGVSRPPRGRRPKGFPTLNSL